MAAGQQAAADVLALELERVEPKVPTLFEREDTFFSSIEKATDAEVVSSKDMRIPLELRPGGNFGHYNPDGGTLGRGGAPTYDKAVVGIQHLKFGVEWTKKVEYHTDSQRKAVLDVFRRNFAKAMAEFRRHFDSLCMTSGNGVVGTISGVSTAGGKDTYTLATDGFGARLVRFGQYVSVYQSNLSAARAITATPTDGWPYKDGTAAYIDLYDGPNKQIRIAAAAGSVGAGDKLVINGLTGASPVSIFGVPYHHSNASTGSWLGMDRANYPEIRANGVNANSSGLSLPFVRRALNAAGDRLGQDALGKVNAWMHPCQVQAYEELGQLVSVIQKQAKAENLDLFFEPMQLAGAPVKKHYSWDKTRIDFIDSSLWGRAEMVPAGFHKVEGRRIFELRDSGGGIQAAQIFYLVGGWQLWHRNPAAGTYVYGLAVPAGY